MAVDGKVVTELGTKVDPDLVCITVDGRRVEPVEKKIYILLNKPVGYTSTRSDPHARHTVMELVEGVDAYLYPVGRLDVDTSGLLILTNDGDFTKLLTHPSHQVDKTYVAVVQGRISAQNLSRLERGVKIEEGATAPASARMINYSPANDTSSVEIAIHEGRKRQVRRMFEVIGHTVLRLSRVRIGKLGLEGLNEGQFRYLTQKEVAELRRLAMPAKKEDVKRGPGRR